MTEPRDASNPPPTSPEQKNAVSRPGQGANWLALLPWGLYVLLLTAGGVFIGVRTAQVWSPHDGCQATWATRVGCLLFPPTIDLVAAKDLARFHRIRKEDLKPPDGLSPFLATRLSNREPLIGLYLKQKVKEGRPIRPDALSSRPKLAPPDQSVYVSLSLDSELVPLLDVGTRVDICPVNADSNEYPVCLFMNKAIVALDCRSSNDQSCFAVIELSVDQKDEFLNFGSKVNQGPKENLKIVVSGMRESTKAVKGS